jgi:hypothetical protein
MMKIALSCEQKESYMGIPDSPTAQQPAGAWFVIGKSRSDFDPSEFHSEAELYGALKTWGLMRFRPDEPTFSEMEVLVDEHSTDGEFQISGFSSHSRQDTWEILLELSSIIAAVLDQNSVEYGFADEHRSITRREPFPGQLPTITRLH